MTDINTLLSVADSAAIRVLSFKSQDSIRLRIAALRAELAELEGKISGSDEDAASAEADYQAAVGKVVALGLARDKVELLVTTRVALLKDAGLLEGVELSPSVAATKERSEVEKSTLAPAKTEERPLASTAVVAEVTPVDEPVAEIVETPTVEPVIEIQANQEAVVTGAAPEIQTADVVEPEAVVVASPIEKPAPTTRPTPSNSMSRTRRPSPVVVVETPAPVVDGADQQAPEPAVAAAEQESNEPEGTPAPLVDQVFGVDTDAGSEELKEDFLTGLPLAADSAEDDEESGEVEAEAEIELAAAAPEPEIDLDSLPAFLR